MAATSGHFVANVVCVLHVLLVVAIVWAPFSGNELAITMHFTLLPFVFAHWLMAQDTCCLTVLECWCRGVPADESFFSRLIGAVYRVGYADDDAVRRAVWVAALGLWGVSAYHVSRDPGMIKRTFFPPVDAASEKPEAAAAEPEGVVKKKSSAASPEPAAEVVAPSSSTTRT